MSEMRFACTCDALSTEVHAPYCSSHRSMAAGYGDQDPVTVIDESDYPGEYREATPKDMEDLIARVRSLPEKYGRRPLAVPRDVWERYRAARLALDEARGMVVASPHYEISLRARLTLDGAILREQQLWPKP